MAEAKTRLIFPATFGEILRDFLQSRIESCRQEIGRRPHWANERIEWESQLCAYEHLMRQAQTCNDRDPRDA
jgi:hypothetical protein